MKYKYLHENLFCVLLLLSSIFSISLCLKNKKPSVLIIGAGVSGISTGYELQKQGVNVLLLEARGRPGGRVKTESNTFGYPVDHGAIWVDFTEKGNPFEKYMKTYNTKLVPVDPSDATGFDREGIIYKDYSLLMTRILKSFKEFLMTMKLLPKSTVKNYLRIFKDSLKPSLRDYQLLEDCLKILIFDLNEIHNKDSIQTEIESYINFNRKGYYMLPNGYMEFFNHFLKSLKVNYNTIVKKITQMKDQVIVEDSNGNKYYSDYVVVTVPLKILKENYIEFSPKLSEEKTQLIKNYPVTTINKLFVEFEEKFWDNHFTITLHDEKVPLFFGINFNKVNGKNLLIFIINDTSDYKFSSFSLEENRNYILSKLKKCYPDKIIKITKITKTSWDTDKFSMASFSNIPYNFNKDYVKIFRKPEGRIYFAGEHTSYKNASTQGAWKSGEAASKQIMQRLSKE